MSHDVLDQARFEIDRLKAENAKLREHAEERDSMAWWALLAAAKVLAFLVGSWIGFVWVLMSWR